MFKAFATELARQQHGVVASWQLRAHATKGELFHLLTRSGNWRKVHNQVFCVAGLPTSVESTLMAGLLASGPGSVVARESAAALWGLPAFTLLPCHVLRTKATNSTRPPTVLCHDTRRLPENDVVTLNGFPVTTPTRTVVDLARQSHPERTERVLDAFWSRRLLDRSSILACCERLGTRGRPEVRVMLGLVGDRPPAWIAPASGLETRLNQVLRNAGLGSVERQANIGGQSWLARVDFLHSSGLVIEAQSELHHAALSSRRDDEIRFAALAEAGHPWIEVWEHHIWNQPAQVVSAVRKAIDNVRIGTESSRQSAIPR